MLWLVLSGVCLSVFGVCSQLTAPLTEGAVTSLAALDVMTSPGVFLETLPDKSVTAPMAAGETAQTKQTSRNSWCSSICNEVFKTMLLFPKECLHLQLNS